MRLGCQARSFGKGIYPDEQTFVAVLGAIGELGFDGVEANWKNMARYFGTPHAFTDKLAAANISLLGAHYGGSLWDPAQRKQILAEGEDIARFVAAAGGELLLCSCAAPTADAVIDEAWAQMAVCLNELGGVCAANGIRVAYHNHFWESKGRGLIGLADSTDAANVTFVFDTGNDIQGGEDPVATLRELGDRVALVHLKDYGQSEGAALGEGTLDLDAVKRVLADNRFNGWVVFEEETKPADPRLHAHKCMALLRKFVA